MRSISNPVAALLEPGYCVDRYELLAKIGQGGMASVWLTREQGAPARSFFAIKTILPQHSSDDQLRKMMLDEAKIAMAIDHPNVARTLEVGQLWDMPYLVLEYVSGESLDQLSQTLAARGEQVPPAIAARIVSDTCAGLHAAHEMKGLDGKNLEIVHRDLSPHNILVDDHGTVKLIDFGIAKASERLSETQAGVTKGKVPYMAPEQALDAFVDRRADLWSLGAVLYVLLSGKVPFDGANDASRLVKKLSGDPPPALPEAVPKELGDVVLRALAFYREQRYDTAAAFAEAIDAAIPKASQEEVAAFFAKKLAPAVKARGLIIDHALAAAESRARAKEMLAGVPVRRSRAPDGAVGAGAVAAAVERSRSSRSLRAKTAGAAGGVDEGPSVSTIGGPKRSSPPARPWIAYVSAAAITLIVIVAFVLGSQSARGPGPATPDPRRADDGARTSTPRAPTSPTGDVPTPAKLPSTEPTSSGATSSSASPLTSASGRPPVVPTAPVAPPVASTPPTTSASAKKPDKPPEDTIF